MARLTKRRLSYIKQWNFEGEEVSWNQYPTVKPLIFGISMHHIHRPVLFRVHSEVQTEGNAAKGLKNEWEWDAQMSVDRTTK